METERQQDKTSRVKRVMQRSIRSIGRLVVWTDRWGKRCLRRVFTTARLKFVAQMIGLLRAAPALVSYRMTRNALGRERAFSLAAEKVARITGMIGVYARYAFYKQTLLHVGKDVCFGYMSIVSKPDTRVGDQVYLGRFCSVGLADLEDQVMLADGVQILSGRHQHGSDAGTHQALQENDHHYKRVVIGMGSWVGANAVVMNHVGKKSVVGAGAVVVHEVAHEMKVVGVPAKSKAVAPQPKAQVRVHTADEDQQRRLVLRAA
ncbi:acyltransferase [Poriferisphaera sp. WC338]|uniref:acyltransferase n=1 Tax=Poriferisphaera sp. WC338 TaxID=3425129 RepID=UPI003D81B35F